MTKATQSLLLTLVLAGIVFVLVNTSFQNFQVEGTSMTPNIQDGQFILVNKAAYRRVDLGPVSDWLPFLDRDGDGYVEPFGEPERGQVVIFDLESQPGRKFIKRVIGLPGETIEIRPGGMLFVNRVHLDESYLPRLGNKLVQPLVVPPNEYFVMGDERVRSFDSRDWGTLPRRNIIGKAWFSYYPFGEAGLVETREPEF